LIAFAVSAAAQEGGFFSRPREGVKDLEFRHRELQSCRGPINRVLDVAGESWKSTRANCNVPAGGGEGGRFDKTPVLSTKITVRAKGSSTAARRWRTASPRRDRRSC
jgi:hypothetical protein